MIWLRIELIYFSSSLNFFMDTTSVLAFSMKDESYVQSMRLLNCALRARYAAAGSEAADNAMCELRKLE